MCPIVGRSDGVGKSAGLERVGNGNAGAVAGRGGETETGSSEERPVECKSHGEGRVVTKSESSSRGVGLGEY